MKLKNQQLANELRKPIIGHLKKEKCILLLKTIVGMLKCIEMNYYC